MTDERLFENRRLFLKLGAAALVGNGAVAELLAQENTAKEDLPLNTYEQITSYINFYEYSTQKEGIGELAKNLKTSPWEVRIDGEVEKPFTIGIEELLNFPQEERIYRFRCVEGWAMVVPWLGFPLRLLIEKARPLSSAKYVRFETLYDPEQFPDQKRGFLAAIEYPYVEGLRMDEAMHDLSFLALGLYGKKLPNQNGAPLRLVVPWKYGFKSIKSIAKITFTKEEPLNTWQKANPDEYGFYANVNPNVDHPRWSQKKERILGKLFKQETLLFNGYEKEVAHLYKGMDLGFYF